MGENGSWTDVPSGLLHVSAREADKGERNEEM